MPYKSKFIDNLIKKEKKRQNDSLQLIASENYTIKAVRDAQGSILTNKYAEGYPGARYYAGCSFVDEIEEHAINQACKVFNMKYANVQPHSGSSANMAAYMALLEPGDTCLGMSLDAGGHLTHGYKITYSGQTYNFIPYGVVTNPKSKNYGYIDYDQVRDLAKKHRPKLIVAGASAYPRYIDFDKFRKIADEVGAYLMIDMAHIAGLVATDKHPAVNKADIVTSTTHKTLMGPRSGFIMTNDEKIIKKVNKAVFPGMQGGPLMHVIAAKAICFEYAQTNEYNEYIMDVKKSCYDLSLELKNHKMSLVSGGTDNHLLLLDLSKNIAKNPALNGKVLSDRLEELEIFVNKNSVPNDQLPPTLSSGIRIGTACLARRRDLFDKENEKDYKAIIHDLAYIISSLASINTKSTAKEQKLYEDIIVTAQTLFNTLSDYPITEL